MEADEDMEKDAQPATEQGQRVQDMRIAANGAANGAASAA